MQAIWLYFSSAAQDLLSPEGRFFLGYLIFTVMLAVGFYYRRARSWRAAFAAVFRRDVFLHPSAIADYQVAAINFVLNSVVLTLAAATALYMTYSVVVLLILVLGPLPAWPVGTFAIAAFGLASFLTYDLGNFVQHWLQHRVSILWEFHKVHHSAEVLTPITAVRVHPVAELFASQVLASFSAAGNGAFLYFYGGKIAAFTVFGANILFLLHYTIGGYHLQHSHIWINFPPVIRRIFVSPAMHMIHHSRDPRHCGKNFAFALTIWDRFAGTLLIPDDSERERIVFGLAPEDQGDLRDLWQLYATPFKRAMPAKVRLWARARAASDPDKGRYPAA
jgi:sterol desaturase/sphingolipid hydroxylase (fatty acid hydroxylase superfamily)